MYSTLKENLLELRKNVKGVVVTTLIYGAVVIPIYIKACSISKLEVSDIQMCALFMLIGISLLDIFIHTVSTKDTKEQRVFKGQVVLNNKDIDRIMASDILLSLTICLIGLLVK